MAVDMTAVREALAGTIAVNIERAVNLYDGYIPAVPSAPCIVIKPMIGTFDGQFRRPRVELEFEVWLLTDPGMGTDGQRLIDQFLSVGTGQTNSVYDAVAEDPTLGGVVESLTVTGWDYRGRLELNPSDGQMSFEWAAISLTISHPG